MTEELLPCPFCGGEAEIEIQSGDANDGNVWCKSCHSRSPWFDNYYIGDNKAIEKAIKAWNTRNMPEDLEERIEKEILSWSKRKYKNHDHRLHDLAKAITDMLKEGLCKHSVKS